MTKEVFIRILNEEGLEGFFSQVGPCYVSFGTDEFEADKIYILLEHLSVFGLWEVADWREAGFSESVKKEMLALLARCRISVNQI